MREAGIYGSPVERMLCRHYVHVYYFYARAACGRAVATAPARMPMLKLAIARRDASRGLMIGLPRHAAELP